VTFPALSKQGRALSPTGIADRAASLNPAFVAPFDVQALYLH